MMEETGARKVLKDNVELAVGQCSSLLDSVQSVSLGVLKSIHEKLSQIYESGITSIENINIHGKLSQVWIRVGDKCQDVVQILRSSDMVAYVDYIRSTLKNEVSSQAILFGIAGLATGGVIGLCIGYSVKKGSSQFFSTSYSNTLMRAILSSNCHRRIDGITIASTTVPNIINPTHVLIHVKAMGIDNIDVKIACGYKNSLRYQRGLPAVREPFILGRECSGVIIDIGQHVCSLEINDRVCVCLPIWASRGVMSEYIVVPEKYAALKPKTTSFEGAATLPYAAIVVWRKILHAAKLDSSNTKNKRALIHFGSISKNDGVGLLATQVLKAWGARVTISTLEHVDEYNNGSGVAQLTFLHSLKTLGAESHLIIPNDRSLLPNVAQRIFDVVINTDCSDISPLLECFCKDSKDQVLETFPPEVVQSPVSLLHSIIGWPFKLISRAPLEEESTQEILDELRRMVESGMVSPVVAKSFLATQYDQAFRHVVNNSANSALAHVGKSVIVFKSS